MAGNTSGTGVLSRAVLRIKREFTEVLQNKETLLCAIRMGVMKDDNWTELYGEIGGPLGTPYEGGTFMLDIKVPESYPFGPPKVCFRTRIWHPNISSVTGAICLDILKDNWAPAMTLRTMLLSVQALMSAAEPDDPQDAVVANQYKHSYDTFVLTARHWTNAYAFAPHPVVEYDEKVRHLVRMGYDEQKSRSVLSMYNWNVQHSVAFLLSS